MASLSDCYLPAAGPRSDTRGTPRSQLAEVRILSRRPLVLALGEALVAAAVTLRPGNSQTPKLECSVSYASGVAGEEELPPEAALAARTRDAVTSGLRVESLSKSSVLLQLLILRPDVALLSTCVLAALLVGLPFL